MKPVIVIVGLDKVGKTTIAKEVALRAHYYYETFPTKKLPELRNLAKANEIGVMGHVITISPWSRMLAHALSHSLTYDLHRQLLETSTVRGLLCDRYWFCNVAYTALYEKGYELANKIREVELASNPFFPDVVFLVRAERPEIMYAPSDGSVLEQPEKRVAVLKRYMKLFHHFTFRSELHYIENREGEEGKQAAVEEIMRILEKRNLL
jgi:thymidylate kinase